MRFRFICKYLNNAIGVAFYIRYKGEFPKGIFCNLLKVQLGIEVKDKE